MKIKECIKKILCNGPRVRCVCVQACRIKRWNKQEKNVRKVSRFSSWLEGAKLWEYKDRSQRPRLEDFTQEQGFRRQPENQRSGMGAAEPSSCVGVWSQGAAVASSRGSPSTQATSRPLDSGTPTLQE